MSILAIHLLAAPQDAAQLWRVFEGLGKGVEHRNVLDDLRTLVRGLLSQQLQLMRHAVGGAEARDAVEPISSGNMLFRAHVASTIFVTSGYSRCQMLSQRLFEPAIVYS